MNWEVPKSLKGSTMLNGEEWTHYVSDLLWLCVLLIRFMVALLGSWHGICIVQWTWVICVWVALKALLWFLTTLIIVNPVGHNFRLISTLKIGENIVGARYLPPHNILYQRSFCRLQNFHWIEKSAVERYPT
jgi:hypothetical protein